MPFDASYAAPAASMTTMQDMKLQQQQIEEGQQRMQLNLRNAVLDGQLGQQKVQENALDIQQKQIEMQDQANMRRAYMESGGDMQKYQSRAMQLGVSQKAIAGIQAQILDIQTKHADLTDKQLKNEGLTTQAMGSAANSLLAMPDDATRAPQWPAVRQQMITQGHANPADIPVEYPGENWLTMHRNFAVSSEQAIENTYKDREAKAAAQRAGADQQQADTAKAKFDLEKDGLLADANQKQAVALAPQLEAEFKRGGPDAVNRLLDQTPRAIARRFEGFTKPGDFNAAALTPDQATTTGETAKRDADTEADRKVMQGQGAARLRLEGQAQFLRQRTFDVTMDNAKKQGLLGVPPHLIGPASAAFEKAGNEFATASAAADTMQSLLDLAEKGNKAAGSNVPLVGVETLNAINGIKRINGAEIAQYGSAGSLLDELKGKLGKLTVGQPISADVLKDIRELHTEIAKQAGTTYARKTQVTNQTYGSQFTPVQFGAAAAATPAAGGAPTVATQAQFDELPRGAVYLEDGKKYKKP